MTYSVGLSQREIGVRMAIDADPGGVLKMVLKKGFRRGDFDGAAGSALLRLGPAGSDGRRSADRCRCRSVPPGSARFAGGSEYRIAARGNWSMKVTQEILDDLNYLNTGEIKSFCKQHSIP